MITKPRIALIIGIVCISIFPVLVKLNYTPGLISAFYRMAIALSIILPYVLFTKQLKIPDRRTLLLTVICGICFGSDVAVWNIAIQESTATQASFLTNLSPVWVGIGTFFFLKPKPSINFWIGTLIALLGMVTLVGFKFFAHLSFDIGFSFGVLSGVFYAIYILISKEVLAKTSVVNFMTLSLISSSFFLGILSYSLGEPFNGFSNIGWFVLVIQGLVCQLLAWLSISYSTQHMRATRVSLSLLAQAILAAILAWIFLNELITPQMILGGIILLFGIRITFYDKPLVLPMGKKAKLPPL
ncbi:Permease of the drug/metabolite transporter (DMT) superfamily [Arenibacter palladensis]|uniref:Permease of the drug/metabolite transporter (DMT) superfamily n=1 Tax=Arenibacter palladensis TaxID=237373 RepID=A0A1M5H8Z1_9FLAO|nr:DMT family transporter [Arenibacter palladensis]SHG12368.1 Permease of the drug/metabolite transporter (DMT) superfamily [Arenibacter palladensis]